MRMKLILYIKRTQQNSKVSKLNNVFAVSGANFVKISLNVYFWKTAKQSCFTDGSKASSKSKNFDKMYSHNSI